MRSRHGLQRKVPGYRKNERDSVGLQIDIAKISQHIQSNRYPNRIVLGITHVMRGLIFSDPYNG